MGSAPEQGVSKRTTARIASDDGGAEPVSPVGHDLFDAAGGVLVRRAVDAARTAEV